ncbi:hypothetical protein GCM10028791_29440 [Echinicola sediminis]
MSRFFILIFIVQTASASILLGAASKAQNKSVYEIDLQVDFEHTELEAVFDFVEQHSAFKFSYHSSVVNQNHLISVKGALSLGELLEVISSSGKFQFQRTGDNIHVYKSTKTKKAVVEILPVESMAKVIQGIVRDENDEPIPGVAIQEQGTSNGTVTGIDGEYSIDVEEGATLVFSFFVF